MVGTIPLVARRERAGTARPACLSLPEVGLCAPRIRLRILPQFELRADVLRARTGQWRTSGIPAATPIGSCPAKPPRVVEERKRGGRVAARIVLRKIARERIHLLAELCVPHDGGAPLLHDVVQLGVFAVIGHPARSTQ